MQPKMDAGTGRIEFGNLRDMCYNEMKGRLQAVGMGVLSPPCGMQTQLEGLCAPEILRNFRTVRALGIVPAACARAGCGNRGRRARPPVPHERGMGRLLISLGRMGGMSEVGL